jgi:hypothetical protein
MEKRKGRRRSSVDFCSNLLIIIDNDWQCNEETSAADVVADLSEIYRPSLSNSIPKQVPLFFATGLYRTLKITDIVALLTTGLATMVSILKSTNLTI